MKIFSIYDSKAEAYLQPFFAPTKAYAIRQFTQAANDESADFHKFAADYTLFELGSWDEQTGTIAPNEAKTALGSAIEYINQTSGLRAVENK